MTTSTTTTTLPERNEATIKHHIQDIIIAEILRDPDVVYQRTDHGRDLYRQRFNREPFATNTRTLPTHA
eukprot:4495635-Amphidinium_carterae.2